MGGGDLNLKKSWHPQTLQNIEKVWKAEQKAEAESKKIEQLQRELAEERQREEMQRYAVDQGIVKKKSDRLEWMYSAPGHAGVNHEEYLLGKSIDKAVDPLATNDEKNADAPGASFMEDSPSTGNDLAAKIRDDPLFMIKKKENEKKKELLKNPVRMKQLQQMLKADLDKKGRKNKKDKKRKKERKRSSDEKQMKKHGSKSLSKRRNEASDSDSSKDISKHSNGLSNYDRKKHQQSYRNFKENREIGMSSDYRKHEEKRKRKISSGSSEGDERRRRASGRKREVFDNSGQKINKHRRSLSRSPSLKYQGNKRSHSAGERRRDGASLKNHSREKRHHTSEIKENQRHDDRRHRSQSPLGKISSSTKKSKQSDQCTVSRKLTDEERERRLAEMMNNAKWRDEQRDKNVKRYREEDEAEAKQTAQNSEKGASFVQPMKVQTFTSSTATVENRIKRNINSLQRTPAAMEKFLKK